MKKGFFILVLFALATSGVFAQRQSSGGIGAGLQLGLSIPVGDYSNHAGNMIVCGFFTFVTHTFFEVNLGYNFGWGSVGSIDITRRDFFFSALGKFPFDMGAFTLFPLAGLGINMVQAWSFNGESVRRDLLPNPNLFISAGAGADFDLGSRVFIRPSLLFDINLRYLGNNPHHENLGPIMSVMPRVRTAIGFRI